MHLRVMYRAESGFNYMGGGSPSSSKLLRSTAMGTNYPWVEKMNRKNGSAVVITLPKEGRILLFIRDRKGLLQPCLLTLIGEEWESEFYFSDPLSLSWDNDDAGFEEDEAGDADDEDDDLIDDDLFDDDEDDDDYDDDYDDLEEEDDDYDDFDDVEIDQEEDDF